MFYVWDEKQFAVEDKTPRNLVSSTTGTGVPFSSRMGSEWGLRNLQKCMHTGLEGEKLNPLVSAQSASLLRPFFYYLDD